MCYIIWDFLSRFNNDSIRAKNLYKSPMTFKGLLRSDHLAIVVNPQSLAKPERKYVCYRGVREH